MATTTAAPSSPIYSFFHMDMHGLGRETAEPRHSYDLPRETPPSGAVPIIDRDLLFVHLNEATGPTQDLGTRHQVRAHVMREFQRKKHKRTNSDRSRERYILPSASANLYDTQADEGISAVLETTYVADIMIMERVPTPEMVGNMEPFNMLPIAGSPRLQFLVHHYTTVLLNTLVPVNPKTKWLHFAVADPALFYGTIMHSAMHYRLVNISLDMKEEDELKRTTMKMVNERLDDPIDNVSDNTMGAVVCLVLLESQAVNVAVSNIHMNGLQRMVNMRGGVDRLGLGGILQRKVLWADIVNATISGNQPRFNLTQTNEHPVMTARPHQFTELDEVSQSIHETTFLPTPGAPCTCSDDYRRVLELLRSVSNLANIKTDVTGCLSDNIYIAERHLFFLLENARKFPTIHSPICTSIGSSCFIAAQIYLYRTLRDFPHHTPIFGMFIERLNAKFWKTDLRQLWEGKEQMLLWVLAVGALAAFGKGPSQYRYVAELNSVCAFLGIMSLQGFVAEVKNVVWRDAEKDAELEMLWDEMQRASSLEVMASEMLELGF